VNGGVVAVVPIRSLTGGKTRLAGILPPEARAALTRRMLRGVVDAALASGTVASVVVVSPDPAALALAASLNPAVVPLAQDAGAPGLNPAIAAGVRFAAERGAAAVLVLFGDLPLLTGDDVRNLLRRDAPIVLAPDRHGTGTNALLLRLDASAEDGRMFAFQFGLDSYARHVDEAHRLGLDVATSVSAGTALDLDTPEDLRRVLSAECSVLSGEGLDDLDLRIVSEASEASREPAR
jgi:2-phospho-L-lactate/phosphoenolpyruvate guanylyltransferase